MKAAVLILLATPAAAQTTWVDDGFIRNCAASAPRGEVRPYCLGQAANVCQQQPGMGTTIGISDCLQAETAVWDQILNGHYGDTMARYREIDPPVAEQLRGAQRAWIAYRDAECGFQYAIWGNGSMRVTAAATCLMQMTAQRALELRDAGGGQ